MSFAALKRDKDKTLEKLNKEVEKLTGGYDNTADERFWSPTVDKAGNGSAVIRFLPAPGDEPVPFVRIFSHGFKGPTGKWYIEDSLTSIGKEDPVSRYNSELWSQSQDDESWQRKQVRAQKRKLHYVSNVYIVKDPGNPENEGKVKLYKYGKKIFDKLNAKMNPPEDDIEPMNPFDFWGGANFRLRIRKVEGQRNYDSSEFDSRSELLNGDDEALEAIYNQEHSLQALLDPAKFKSYEELEKRLNQVLGNTSTKTDVEKEVKRSVQEREAPEPSKTKEVDDTPFAPDPTGEDDEDLAFFKSLADE